MKTLPILRFYLDSTLNIFLLLINVRNAKSFRLCIITADHILSEKYTLIPQITANTKEPAQTNLFLHILYISSLL